MMNEDRGLPLSDSGSTDASYMVHLSDGGKFGPATLALIVQWATEQRIPNDALLYPTAGGDPKSVLAFPELQRRLSAPPTVSGPLSRPREADTTTSKVIPYRNPQALVGYYLSIFSLLAGPILGIPAIILGIIGLRNRAKNPSIHGSAHAWIAIILGSITSLNCGAWFVLIVLNP